MTFNLTAVDIINFLAIAAGIGVCILCFLQITSSTHLDKRLRNYFQLFFITIFLYISTHLAREIMNGLPGDGIKHALYAVTFIEMLEAGVMTYMLSMLILNISKSDKYKKKIEITLLILLCAHLIILVTGRLFNLIYNFDEMNMYHRANGYLLSNLTPVIMMILDIVLLIKYRKNINRRVYIAFWIYLIAPIIAIAIQSFSYGIQFIIFATVGAAAYMFFVIVRDQNEKYQKQQIESSRIETELTMASSIQSDMLPSIYPAFPERPEMDIYASMDPAKEVGGDFYDFFLVDDDHLCLVIADVSGKGVPAALFMMASKIILANNAMLGKSPAQILTDANNAICSNNREEMFVTVWLGILELSTGKLTAANAGHEYPVIQNSGKKFELLKDKHGFVVGGMEGIRYKQYELQMEPGSKLFIYTDGVPEATNAKKELYGTDRMLEALNEDTSLSPKNILTQVRQSVDKFVKNAEQFDDLTMLCIEYKGPQQDK